MLSPTRTLGKVNLLFGAGTHQFPPAEEPGSSQKHGVGGFAVGQAVGRGTCRCSGARLLLGDAVGGCCQNPPGLNLPSVRLPGPKPAPGGGSCHRPLLARCDGQQSCEGPCVNLGSSQSAGEGGWREVLQCSRFQNTAKADCLLRSTSLFMAWQPVPKEMAARGCHFAGMIKGGTGGGVRLGLKECFSGGLSGCRTPRGKGRGRHPGRTWRLGHGG